MRPIRNIYDIEKLLIRVFGDDIDIKPFTSKMGIIEGDYKEMAFNILFEKDSYLIFSAQSGNELLLKEMEPILSRVMDASPICSYDIKKNDNKDITISTIEWEINDPKLRIHQIENEYTKDENINISNIQIFNRGTLVDINVKTLKKQS